MNNHTTSLKARGMAQKAEFRHALAATAGRLRAPIRPILISGVIALVIGTWADTAPSRAQVPACAAGYYFASDGQCYPGYPPPVYDSAPPVYQPPVVFDGLALGLGVGALIGNAGRGGGFHGGGRGGVGRGGGVVRGGGGRGAAGHGGGGRR